MHIMPRAPLLFVRNWRVSLWNHAIEEHTVLLYGWA
jgi:hypothetical protein